MDWPCRRDVPTKTKWRKGVLTKKAADPCGSHGEATIRKAAWRGFAAMARLLDLAGCQGRVERAYERAGQGHHMCDPAYLTQKSDGVPFGTMAGPAAPGLQKLDAFRHKLFR